MVFLFFHTNDPSKRKAVRWLTQHGIAITQRNIEKDPLSPVEIRRLLSLSLNGTDDRILKNPIIFDDSKLVTGFDQEKMGIFIPKKQRRLELSEMLAKFTQNNHHIKLA